MSKTTLGHFAISSDDRVWIAQNIPTGRPASDHQQNLETITEILRNPNDWLQKTKEENGVVEPRIALSGRITINFRYGWQRTGAVIHNDKFPRSIDSRRMVVKGEFQENKKVSSPTINIDLPAFKGVSKAQESSELLERKIKVVNNQIDISLMDDSLLSYIHFDVIINKSDEYPIFSHYFYRPSEFSKLIYTYSKDRNDLYKLNARVISKNPKSINHNDYITKYKDIIIKENSFLTINPSNFCMTYIYDPESRRQIKPITPAKKDDNPQSLSVIGEDISHCIKLTAQYNPAILQSMINDGTAVAYQGQAYSGLLAPWGGSNT
jgi:hypothetical protein